MTKLTEAERRLLERFSKGYRPNLEDWVERWALVNYGLIELINVRWFVTPAGRAALEAVDTENPDD